MKLLVNQAFPGLLTRTDYALIPVVDRDGRVKVLRINPGREHGDWLRPEWGRNAAGRAVQLVSVDLTSAREAEGCTFLRHAYDAERWPEGWGAFEAYLRAQFHDEEVDERGNVRLRRRARPRLVKPFPNHLLPKSVLARRQEAAHRPKAAEWSPPEGLSHPADREQPQPQPQPQPQQAKRGAA